jgi:hypothetical protein
MCYGWPLTRFRDDSMTRAPATFLLLLAFAPPLRAQTHAVVTDFRMITETNGGDPDTAIIHSISAGKKHRLESSGGSGASLFPLGQNAGKVQIMTLTDSAWTIDYLDSDAKTYIEVKPFEMMKGATEMMKAMGMDMKMTSTADTTVVDSLGDGGLMMGYPTLHFHSLSAYYFTMGMMGESSSLVIHQSADSYVSPRLKQEWAELDSIRFSPERISELMAQVTGGMPGGMDSVMKKALPRMARIARAGVALKTVMETTTTVMGITSHSKQTMEILKVEKAVVPDSTFTIPAGYKKVEPAFKMPPVSGGN